MKIPPIPDSLKKELVLQLLTVIIEYVLKWLKEVSATSFVSDADLHERVFETTKKFNLSQYNNFIVTQVKKQLEKRKINNE